jgi:tetratricopeptide (TPR) repeat protein
VDIGSRAIHLLEENHLEKDFFGMGICVYSDICNVAGYSLGMLGRFKEGTGVIEKGFRIACEANDKYEMGQTQNWLSMLTYFAGYGDSTIMHSQKAIKIFEEAGISIGLDAWFVTGGGYYLCGEYDKAIDAGEKGLTFAKELGLPFVAAGYIVLAMTLWDAGDLRRARECAEEGLRIAQECKTKLYEGMALIILGHMVEEMTPAIIEEAERKIRQGISIAEGLESKVLSACGYLLLGEFLARAGRKEEALENLRKAETLYQEMEVTAESYWLRRTREALAKLKVV